MANTYDVSKLDLDINKVRLLISDTTVAEGKYIFHDEEIEALLLMEGPVVLTAAKALEVIAANETMVQKRIQILDLRTDGPAEATALLAIAERFRETYESSAESDDAGFEIAGLPLEVFARDQVVWNELMESYSE